VYGLTLGEGNERWSCATRSVVNSAPLIAGDVLYFGSLDRTLYALQKYNGTELWKFTMPGRIKVSPVIWNNTMLVTSEDKFIIALRPE
jgi:outer membrane protein assembly factor BamB